MPEGMAPAGDSSLLVHRNVLLGEAFLGVLSAGFGMTLLAGLLLFLSAAGAAAHLWARLSAKALGLTLTAKTTRLFPGEETTLTYAAENNKLLPLIWMEVVHALPDDPPFAPKEAALEAEDGRIPAQEFKKRFSLILWRQTLCWDETWYARRRGVYRQRVALRTGDGFGLLQRELPLSEASRQTFAVYPALVPVQVQLFLRNQWDARSGARGFAEDPTVIRATRPYQPTDSMRRINWRLAARQQPLAVNRYETILPKSAHFILDSESYNGFVPHAAEWEEALSILASVLLSLDAAHVGCGLSLNRMGKQPAVNLLATDGSPISEMLFALAGCRLCALKPMSDLNDPAFDRVAPPVFAARELLAASHAIGRFYYVAYDLDGLAKRALLSRLDPGVTTLLVSKEPEKRAAGPLGAFPVVPLSRLRKGGAAR